MEEIEHGVASIWKTASAGAPTANFAAVLMTPLCVTTMIFLPGYSATNFSKASSIRSDPTELSDRSLA
jgi:hypothetical protein